MREQPSSRRQHPVDQPVGYVVSGEVKEADLVGDLAEPLSQLARRVTEVHFRQRRDA